MSDFPFERLHRTLAPLPFALDDYDAAAATFARWRAEGGAADWEATVLWIYGYSYRTLYRRFAREPAAAAADVDLLVDRTFVKAVDALGTVRDASKLPHFVSVVCKRALLSYRERCRPTEALDEERLTAPPRPDDLDGPLVRWAVEQAIGALPPALRVVAQMRILEEAEYAAIAEATGHPLPTVRTYLSKAVHRLRADAGLRALALDFDPLLRDLAEHGGESTGAAPEAGSGGG